MNMGHLPQNQMWALLKAAGAKQQVLHYVKNEFQCNQYMRQQRSVSRRKAAFPRTFTFNRILGLDYFFISWQSKTLAFLNVVCHGSNLQQVALLRGYEGGTPNSKSNWKLFNELWVRPFGLREVIITDGGGEFRYDFERSAEQAGLMHVVTDTASPWQNGRAERHGGWIKHKIEEELQSGQSVVTTEEDLDLLVLCLVANKNRYFHRGGYSPYQLTFGLNPRLPQELLTGDPLQEPGRSDINADSFEQDSAAAEFNRAFRIRDKARQLCMTSNAKEKIRLSSPGQLHQQRQWHVGQWVNVWRKFSGSCNQMSVDRTRIGGASIRPYGVGVYEGSAAEVQQRSSVT